METFLRAVGAFLAFFATFFLVQWIACSLLGLGEKPWIAVVLSLPYGVGAWWLVWSRTERAPRGLISCVAKGAALLGSVGFAIGFVGPMILWPDSNQGPLFGFLVSGPLGAVAGAVGGFIWWMCNARSE